MTHLFSGRWMIVLVVLCFILTASVSRSGAIDATATSEATSEAGLPAVAEDGGPGTFNLPAPAVGLPDLSSYKATLIRTFEGTQNGQPVKQSQTSVMLTSKEPASRQLNIKQEGEAPLQVFRAEADGIAYERSGASSCAATQINDDYIPLATQSEPALFLMGVIGAEEAGSNSVNGLAVKHYTFDERAVGQQGMAKSSGEMWIASDGGYVVKYVLMTKGAADYFGEGMEGTLTSDYELTDVNKSVVAKLPPDCPKGMVNAPLLPDATNVDSKPAVITFESATSIADASAFYQKNLSDLGWKPLGLPTISDTIIELAYTQQDKKLIVTLIADNGSTFVYITLGPAADPKPPTPTKRPTSTKPPTRTPAPTKTPVPTRTLAPTKTAKP